MFKITSLAQVKLLETLDSKTADRKVAIRVIHSEIYPERLALAFDKRRKGDQIVESNDGRPLLLIGQDVVNDLNDRTIDYHAKETGGSFTITKYPQSP